MKFHDRSILLNRSGSTHFILSVDRRCKVRPIQWPSQNLKQSKLLVPLLSPTIRAQKNI